VASINDVLDKCVQHDEIYNSSLGSKSMQAEIPRGISFQFTWTKKKPFISASSDVDNPAKHANSPSRCRLQDPCENGDDWEQEEPHSQHRNSKLPKKLTFDSKWSKCLPGQVNAPTPHSTLCSHCHYLGRLSQLRSKFAGRWKHAETRRNHWKEMEEIMLQMFW
jgi:hypothetical protein